MIFTRQIDAGDHPLAGPSSVSCSTPSTRKRTRSSRPSGSKWMSEAPSLDAPGRGSQLTSLMTGASSARLAQVDDLGDVARRSSSIASLDDLVEAAEAR